MLRLLTKNRLFKAISLCLPCYLFSISANNSLINPVDHKNSQLNLYLDLIKYNTQEKLGILPYILKNPDGIYLEIGTGGDPIAELLSKIPDKISPLIIASDVDENILKILPTRHPKLNKYLSLPKTGPQLKLQQLDATQMSCFPSNYLLGINASAVVHEIVSYAGGIEALDKFFSEAFRTLKPEGVLIYRDPEAVSQKRELVKASFKSSPIRLFVHIFLSKFLDSCCGQLSKSGKKYINYDLNDIKFIFYKKNELMACEYTYEQYLKTRSYEIDFIRPYSVCMPRGLCREIERHYLTYLHQCNPLIFVRCLPQIDSDSYLVNYLAHSTSVVLDDFLIKNGASLTDGIIDVPTKRLIDITISNRTKAIEYGIPLHFNSREKERFLGSLLKEYGFEPNIYIIHINDGDCLLDYRIFGVLYDYINEKVFDSENGPINKEDVVHALYLKREGEETYGYYSDDELILKVAEISLSHTNNNSERYVLCPLSPDHNKFVPRLCYDEVLKSAIDINDVMGYAVEIKEGKRIVHFGKIPLQKAIVIYQEIIKTDPQRYVLLKQFVDTVLAKKLI
jgi:SAM-dependent methyltransferase